MDFSKYATEKYRWWALVVLSLGLAIVIIDNTVLNVAIPYILRDLNSTLDGLQWVISGYALIIATLLITIGRVSDIFGRKKIFVWGIVLFAIGSFIASISKSVGVLFIGEAVIEAIGAAMMLVNSLALITTEFKGRERSIAFGIWGAVAGASASIGPLLGGYFTTYYSWRWSLRINVAVAVLAILGSIFIEESKGEGEKKFDWRGTLLSMFGLFSLVFAVIEGQRYGWWHPAAVFSIGNWTWFSTTISIIPVAFALSLVLLTMFIVTEYKIESNGGVPLIRPSMFKNRGFGLGLLVLTIISLGQFGIFFVLPIYLQSVLGLDALKTGYVFLSSSLALLVTGPLSGYLASRFDLKWVISIGMVILSIGSFWVMQSLSTTATGWSLAPALVIFGIGISATGAQLTNLILASVPHSMTGEASALNTTIRQIGTSIGIAVLGVVLASSLSTKISSYVNADQTIPISAKIQILDNLENYNVESGSSVENIPNSEIAEAVKNDVKKSMTDASRRAMGAALIFIVVATLLSFFMPSTKLEHHET